MALSDYDILAMEFCVYERRWNTSIDGPYPKEAKDAEKELDIIHKEYQDKASAEYPDEDDRALWMRAFSEVGNDERASFLYEKERESKTIRKTKVMPSNGVFTDEASGFSAHIRKTWLTIDSNAEFENTGFSPPAFMTVEEGNMKVGPFHIEAIRGPQNGIFLVVRKKELLINNLYNRHSGMIACGVYGYAEEDGEYDDDGYPEFIGVSKDTHQWFLDKLEDNDEGVIRFLAKEYFKDASRFNQGDKFFADYFGTEVEKSSPGQENTPIFQKLLKEG